MAGLEPEPGCGARPLAAECPAMATPPPPYPGVPSGGKLDTADSFDRIFALYRHQFAVLLGTALVIFVPIGVLGGIVASSGSVFLAFVVLGLSLVGSALYTGAVVEAVNDMRDGRRDFSVGDLLQAASPFIMPLIAAGFLYGAMVVVGLILLIVPGLIFLTWFCLFAPAIVIERRGVFDAFTRSRELVSGNGWRVFGVLVVAILIQSVLQNLLQRIALNAGDSVVLFTVVTTLASVITAPILSLSVSVIYFQLRDLKEGTQGFSGPVPPPQV
jgi:hypothetical protein